MCFIFRVLQKLLVLAYIPTGMWLLGSIQWTGASDWYLLFAQFSLLWTSTASLLWEFWENCQPGDPAFPPLPLERPFDPNWENEILSPENFYLEGWHPGMEFCEETWNRWSSAVQWQSTKKREVSLTPITKILRADRVSAFPKTWMFLTWLYNHSYLLINCFFAYVNFCCFQSNKPCLVVGMWMESVGLHSTLILMEEARKPISSFLNSCS